MSFKLDHFTPTLKQYIIVSLKTTYYKDSNDYYHYKKSIRILKRKSENYDYFEEDANIDLEQFFQRIVNLHEAKDGYHEVWSYNETRDWETGYIDDWEYKLVKVNI